MQPSLSKYCRLKTVEGIARARNILCYIQWVTARRVRQQKRRLRPQRRQQLAAPRPPLRLRLSEPLPLRIQLLPVRLHSRNNRIYNVIVVQSVVATTVTSSLYIRLQLSGPAASVDLLRDMTV